MWAGNVLSINDHTGIDSVLPVRAVAAEDEDLPNVPAAAVVTGDGSRKAVALCQQVRATANATRKMVEVVCMVLFLFCKK